MIKSIKIYSECGALQLLIDFGATSCWITEKVLVSDDIRQFLRSIEILRICEGVGRLLLRQPGETIIMNTEGNILIGDSFWRNPYLNTSLDDY